MSSGSNPVHPSDYADPDASRAVVARIVQGDIPAFEAVYTALYPELLRAAIRLVRLRELAEEIIQDVFAAVWTHRATWTVRTTVRAYLHGAVRYRAATVLRAERGQRSLEKREDEDAAGHSEPFLTPDELFDTNTLQGVLLHTIQALPERQREALILWARQRMTLTELGEALGISHVAARKLLVKAQAVLQAVLDRPEYR